MRSLLLLSFVAAVVLSSCLASDLNVGRVYNARIVFRKKANYHAIPLKKRVKEVFYADPHQQILRGIIAKDLDHSESNATITAGGVGFSFANIRLKSARGHGLNYQIEMFV
ncbi:uncharacterized protein LOC112053416 [Bicyclus anynana]|uniref:Uncharacterized protein LOC112053416 n=1 Tax=Bicyclus anynana TaxID=110368 RepID=A0ABM3LF55_BICAN|nr:uncharacterized protein LOC112053416 [Bicyclus anynana]